MAKIDKAKEYIGILKVYMSLLVALLISVVAGTARLYNNNIVSVTFWLGIVATMVISIIFLKVASHTHKKIDELEDM